MSEKKKMKIIAKSFIYRFIAQSNIYSSLLLSARDFCLSLALLFVLLLLFSNFQILLYMYIFTDYIQSLWQCVCTSIWVRACIGLSDMLYMYIPIYVCVRAWVFDDSAPIKRLNDTHAFSQEIKTYLCVFIHILYINIIHVRHVRGRWRIEGRYNLSQISF